MYIVFDNTRLDIFFQTKGKFRSPVKAIKDNKKEKKKERVMGNQQECPKKLARTRLRNRRKIYMQMNRRSKHAALRQASEPLSKENRKGME